MLEDMQVLCDLEIDISESRSTWQQVRTLLADCFQSNSISQYSHQGPKGLGKTKSEIRQWYKDNTY